VKAENHGGAIVTKIQEGKSLGETLENVGHTQKKHGHTHTIHRKGGGKKKKKKKKRPDHKRGLLGVTLQPWEGVKKFTRGGIEIEGEGSPLKEGDHKGGG